MIVTIDGGAASGKSTTAKLLAQKAHFLYVDTGAHYRALTALFLKLHIDPTNEQAIEEALNNTQLNTAIEGNEAVLLINNEPIPDEILRNDAVNQNVSKYASLEKVRNFLLRYQRSFAKDYQKFNFKGLIMEGRDISTVIFPNADYKFFIYANEATRMKRRALQGQSDSISERDLLDQQRKTAPLKCPDDAIKIDNSELSIDQVVKKIYSIIHNEKED